MSATSAESVPITTPDKTESEKEKTKSEKENKSQDGLNTTDKDENKYEGSSAQLKVAYPPELMPMDAKLPKDQKVFIALLHVIPSLSLRKVVEDIVTEHTVVINNPIDRDVMLKMLIINDGLPSALTTDDILKLTDIVPEWNAKIILGVRHFLACGVVDRVFHEMAKRWEQLDQGSTDNVISKFAFIFNKIAKRRGVDTYETSWRKIQADLAKIKTPQAFSTFMDLMFNGFLNKKTKDGKKKDKTDSTKDKTDSAKDEKKNEKQDDTDYSDLVDDRFDYPDDTDYPDDIFSEKPRIVESNNLPKNWYNVPKEETDDLFKYVEDEKYPIHECANHFCIKNGKRVDDASKFVDLMDRAFKLREEARFKTKMAKGVTPP